MVYVNTIYSVVILKFKIEFHFFIQIMCNLYFFHISAFLMKILKLCCQNCHMNHFPFNIFFEENLQNSFQDKLRMYSYIFKCVYQIKLRLRNRYPFSLIGSIYFGLVYLVVYYTLLLKTFHTL